MTPRELGYNLERLLRSIEGWLGEYFRVFFWNTNWLDASIFMLFWVLVGYLALVAIGINYAGQINIWVAEQLEHREKYKKDEDYRQQYDREKEKQKQLEQDAHEEYLKNRGFFERYFWLIFFIVLIVCGILAELTDG